MQVRWSLVLLSAFVFWLGSGIPASSEEWKAQSYPDDGFQVDFSGPVTISETAMSDETKSRIVRATNYLQDGSASAYFVAAMLMKESVNFDGGSADAFLMSQCRSKKETTVILAGAEKGLEIVGSNCLGNGSHFEQRFFQRGKWFYQVTAIYTADNGAEAAHHFLTSFKLLWQADLRKRARRV